MLQVSVLMLRNSVRALATLWMDNVCVMRFKQVYTLSVHIAEKGVLGLKKPSAFWV